MIIASEPRILASHVNSTTGSHKAYVTPYREKHIDPHTKLDDYLDPVSKLIVHIMRQPEHQRTTGERTALNQWLAYRAAC